MNQSARSAFGVAMLFAAASTLIPSKKPKYVPKTEWVKPLQPKTEERVLH